MSANNSISARTQRLNKLIVCCSDESNAVGTHSATSAAISGGSGSGHSGAVGQSLNRETLLDAFDVLYQECSKDALRKNDRNIGDFSKKCKCSKQKIADQSNRLLNKLSNSHAISVAIRSKCCA